MTCAKCKQKKPLTEFWKNQHYCKPCCREVNKQWWKSPNGRACASRWNKEKLDSGKGRKWYLKRKYGITPEIWNAIFERQMKMCAICKTETPNRSWHVDHDHSTGKVRGILCDICNRIILPAIDRYRSLIAVALKYVNQ